MGILGAIWDMIPILGMIGRRGMARGKEIKGAKKPDQRD